MNDNENNAKRDLTRNRREFNETTSEHGTRSRFVITLTFTNLLALSIKHYAFLTGDLDDITVTYFRRYEEIEIYLLVSLYTFCGDRSNRIFENIGAIGFFDESTAK